MATKIFDLSNLLVPFSELQTEVAGKVFSSNPSIEYRDLRGNRLLLLVDN